MKKNIKQLLIAFTFIFLMLTTITNVEGYKTVSSFPTKITVDNYPNYENYVWNKWNRPNGITYMPYKSADDIPTFCTKFSNQEPPANLECFFKENDWSEPVQAGVAAIIKKAEVEPNVSSDNLNYYYAEIAINRFLYEYNGWNTYNRVYGGANTKRLLSYINEANPGYYSYFTAAMDAYKKAKTNVTVKLSTNDDDGHTLDSLATGSQKITQHYKINGNADSYKVKYNLTGGSTNNYSIKINGQTVNNNTYVNLSNKEFNVTVTFDVENLSADKNVRVDVTVEGTSGYDVAANYNCEGYQSLTPNMVKATSKSASATDAFTITIPEQQRPDLEITKCEDTGCTKKISKDVTFQLLKDNEPIQTFRAINGYRKISNLSDGEYCVKEVHAPDGYELSDVSYCFNVTTTNGNVSISDYDRQYIEVEENSDPKHISLNFRDNPTRIKVAKVNTAGEKMAGFGLQLEDKDGNIISAEGVEAYWGNTSQQPLNFSNNQIKWTSRADEGLFIYGLPHGTYYLKEYSVPEESDYVLNPDRVEIVISETDVSFNGDDETSVIKMVDDKARVLIRKIDSSTQLVTGANLQIEDENHNIVTLNGTQLKWESLNEDHVIKGLKPGTYYIHETSPAPGYKITNEYIQFEIDEYGALTVTDEAVKNSTIEVTNEKNSFKVSKKIFGTNTNLGGAELQILNSNKSPLTIEVDKNNHKISLSDVGGITKWETDAEYDYTIEGLPVGTYYIHEYSAPEGYGKCKEDIEIEVAANGNVTIKRQNSNTLAIMYDTKNVFSVSKQDSNGNLLAGAEFAILDSNKSTIAFTVDEENHKITYVGSSGGSRTAWSSAADDPFTIEGLPVGTYYIRENHAPEGYVKNANDIKVTINEFGEVTIDDHNAEDSVVVVVVKNKKTEFKVAKQDAKGKLVEGARLQLLDSKGKVVGINVDKDKHKITYPGGNTYWETSEDSAFEIEGLPVGSYEIKEIKAPKGYVLSDETIKFTVNEDGTISVNGEEQDSATLIMTNDNTKVFISKQDITTKQELPGAHLVVKDQDGNIVKDGEWDSTTEPHLIEGLGEGTYTITETIAPDGYTKSEETVTFTIDANGALSGNTIMYNTPIPDVPQTLSNQSIIITIAGIILVGTGVGLYIYGIKKKKEI